MAQNELDEYKNLGEKAEQVIQEPKDPNTTTTEDITDEEEQPEEQKVHDEEEIELIWPQNNDEIIPFIPARGRKTAYFKRICNDFYLLKSPDESIRKDNTRKQFIRGFRTAVEEVINPSVTQKNYLHSFDPNDQYRKGKWKELEMLIYGNPDIWTVARIGGKRETGEYVSFNNAFCKAVLMPKGAVQAFKVYIQLVFGECEEGLEERLLMGVRAQGEYEKKGYWERLMDYLSTTMISELVPSS